MWSDGVAVHMSREPQDEVFIGVEFDEQLPIGAIGSLCPNWPQWIKWIIGGRRILHGRHIGQQRDMRTDDHELTRGLTLIELIYEPFVAFLVESAGCTAADLVGIVENDKLDGNSSLRIEVIAGKSLLDHFRRESVANRCRRGI